MHIAPNTITKASRALAAAAGAGLLFLFFESGRLPLMNTWLQFLAKRPAEFFAPLFVVTDTPYTLDFDFRLWAFALPAALTLGWAAAPFVPRRRPRWLRGKPPAWAAAAATFIVCAVLAQVLFAGVPHNWDECVYDLQSRIFAAGRLTVPLPPTEKNLPVYYTLLFKNPNFFFAPLEAAKDGRWFTMYPPLYPALLAAGRWARVPWLVVPAAAALGVLVIARLGARLYGPPTGALAALLAATAPFILLNGASYFSEPVFGLFFACFLYCFVQNGEGEQGRAAPAFAMALSFGLAFCVREYAALAAGGPFLLYFLVKNRRRPRALAAFALGAAAPAALYLGYDWAITGNPLVLPRAFAKIRHFGFGADFGVCDAFSFTFQKTYLLSSYMFGWPALSLVPAAAYLVAKKPLSPFEKLLACSFGATTLLHIPVANPGILYGPRYYFALAPGFVILTARALGYYHRRWPAKVQSAATATVALLIITNLTLYLPHEAAKAARHPSHVGPWLSRAERAYVARAGIAPAVVFVRPRVKTLPSHPNSPLLDDAIIFARDQGPRNAELMALFPQRRYFRLDYATFKKTRTLVEISPPREPSAPPRDE